MFELSCMVLILWIIFYVAILISGIQMGRKDILRYWMLFVIAYAIFSFFAEPSFSDDLYRHYQLIDLLREGNDLKGHFVDTMVLFKWMLIAVSKTNHNGWLPFVAVVIWGWLICKVIKKYIYENTYNTRTLLLYFMALFGTFCSFNLISGIRAALTIAIFVYSVYYNYLEGKKVKHFIILIVFSFLHFMLVLFIGIQCVYELILFMRKKGINITWIILVLAAIIFSTNIVGRLLANQPGILGFISEKWYFYQEWTRDLTFELIMHWAGMLYVLFSGFKIRHKSGHNDFRVQFPQLLVLISIVTNRMPIIANRMPMPVAAFSLPILNSACSTSKGKMWTLWIILGYAVFTLEAVYLIYAMFGFISFNGINIQETIREIIIL